MSLLDEDKASVARRSFEFLCQEVLNFTHFHTQIFAADALWHEFPSPAHVLGGFANLSKISVEVRNGSSAWAFVKCSLHDSLVLGQFLFSKCIDQVLVGTPGSQFSSYALDGIEHCLEDSDVREPGNRGA